MTYDGRVELLHPSTHRWIAGGSASLDDQDGPWSGIVTLESVNESLTGSNVGDSVDVKLLDRNTQPRLHATIDLVARLKVGLTGTGPLPDEEPDKF